MVQNSLFTPRRLRQVLSIAIATVLIGSVTYLGVQRYNSSDAATGGTMSLNPASGTVTNGSTISVTIRENSGTEPVNSVQASVGFSTGHLQYLSMTEGGSFPIIAANSTNTPGIVRVGRATETPVTGDKPIVTLNFKVLATSGSIPITIDKGFSFIVSSNDNQDMLSVVNGATFTVQGGSSGTAPVLTLSPASGSYQTGQTISVAVRVVSPSIPITTVQMPINFPANQLEYLGRDEGGVFPTAQRSPSVPPATAGFIDFIRGVAGGSTGVTGSQLIVTAKFKVIGTSGSAALTFRNNAAAFDNSGSGNNILNYPGSTGSSYNITSTSPPPPPPTPPGPGPTPPPPTPPSPNPTPTPTPNPTPTPTPSPNPTPNPTPTPTPRPPVNTPSGNLTVKPQSVNSTASINGNSTEISGEVVLSPVVDPGILENDDTGAQVTKVEYYLNKKLSATKSASPYNYTFDTKKLRNGVYDIMVKTYYKNGTVDTTNDKLTVKNPVTLSYLLGHYLLQILAVLLILLLLGFLLWKFLASRGGGDGYDGGDYVYSDLDTGSVVTGSSPVAPDPAMVLPGSQSYASTPAPTVAAPQSETTPTPSPNPAPTAAPAPSSFSAPAASPAVDDSPQSYNPQPRVKPAEPSSVIAPSQPTAPDAYNNGTTLPPQDTDASVYTPRTRY